MTSPDEERETLIAKARSGWVTQYLDHSASAVPVAEFVTELADALYNAHRTLEFDKHHMDDLAAALASQRPVWEVQAEALEEAADAMSAQRTLYVNGPRSGTSHRAFYSDWLRARARSVRRWATIPAHSHAPDTGMWAGCQACTAGGGG